MPPQSIYTVTWLKGRMGPLVAVPMVFVRRVWMDVLQWIVAMPVRVRLTDRVHRPVCMSMVFVVGVRMLMCQGRVEVEMFVVLGDVEPHAKTHQSCGDE